MFKRKQLRKHRELEDKYDHYVCEFCMEIGAKEVISDFIKDIEVYLISSAVNYDTVDYKYWEARKEVWENIRCCS